MSTATYGHFDILERAAEHGARVYVFPETEGTTTDTGSCLNVLDTLDERRESMHWARRLLLIGGAPALFPLAAFLAADPFAAPCNSSADFRITPATFFNANREDPLQKRLIEIARLEDRWAGEGSKAP